MNKASEATAENIAAYLDEESAADIKPEIKEILDKYIKKKKKK